MALKATIQWRSIFLAKTTAQNRAFAAATAISHHDHDHDHDIPAAAGTKSKYFSADGTPIMILGGFIVLVLTLGAHSTWQQLAYSPSVQVKKKKREIVPEVYVPEDVLGSSDKFVKKSFLRKVGHIQERNPVLADPIRADPFSDSLSKNVETLKSVGVRP